MNQKIAVIFVAMAWASCKQSENLELSAAVKGSKPLAYYRFTSTKGSSDVGSSTYEFVGGATNVRPGAMLNGKDAWIKTTHMGGIDKAGSIMAWVNLSALPKTTDHIVYVAGESQVGNDFDLQFETDNHLKFYTTGGGRLDYAPDPSALVDRWHMIIATMDTVAPEKAIYWDGQPVAKDKDPNAPKKTSQFAIGESPVFTGRFFHGGIAEVALWDRALSADEVAAIYKASSGKP